MWFVRAQAYSFQMIIIYWDCNWTANDGDDIYERERASKQANMLDILV